MYQCEDVITDLHYNLYTVNIKEVLAEVLERETGLCIVVQIVRELTYLGGMQITDDECGPIVTADGTSL